MSAEEKREQTPGMIELPAPTAWPMITALGITLLCAGLVTHVAVSVVGLILALRGAVGWFREDLPVERHELVRLRPLAGRARSVKVSIRTAAHLRAGEAGHRVRIPAEIHPYSSGIKGGLLGGVVMAIVACAYGLIAYRSVWYPINLLAATALPSMGHAELAQLKAFDGMAFFIALISHVSISILVGLLFAVLLPMFPSRRAAFWGSLTSPLFWSGLVWATLKFVNPALNSRIDWAWFIASQVVFGLVAGYVVHHTKPVETMQTWPLAARAGLEVPGLLQEKTTQSDEGEWQ
jgi:hypothetical protein